MSAAASLAAVALPQETADAAPRPPRQVVIISAVDADPVDSGKKVVLSGFIAYFVRCYGRKHVLFFHVGREPANASQYPCQYRWLPLPSLLHRLPAIIWHAWVTGRHSIQEAMFISRRLRSAIEQSLEEEVPDLIIFDTVRMATCAWAPRWAQKSILYLDDLFSLRYRRMLAEPRLDALGSYAQYFPAWMRSLINLQGLQRRILTGEANRIGRAERYWPRYFRRALLISEEETRLLNSDCKGVDVQSIAPWLQTRPSAPREYHSQRRPLEFVFLGTLNISQNESNIYDFLALHWSACQQAIPGVRLRIIGRHPSARLVKLQQQIGDSVSIEGFVEDLTTVFARAVGLIAPLRFGGGVKLKIIDALALGLPIVSTPVGVEGILIEHGRQGLISADTAVFPEYMRRLVDDVCNASMSSAGRDLFKKCYADDVLTHRYDRLFGFEAIAQQAL